MAQVKGITDLGIFHVLGQPNLNIKVDRDKAARYGLNTGDVNTVVQAAMGGTHGDHALGGRSPVQRDRAAAARVSRQPRRRRQHQGRLPDAERRQCLYSAAASSPTITLDTGASYIYHERNERYIPVKFSVRGRDLGSTVAEAQQRIASEREAADRLSHRMGRRVRRAAASQEPSRGDRADQPASDPGAALRPVQFVARQPDGARRHSLRGRRRRPGALSSPA